MSDVMMKLEPYGAMLAREAREIGAQIETETGLAVDPPPAGTEQRGLDPEWIPPILLLSLRLTRRALEDLDRIIEIARKWVQPPTDKTPERCVDLLGPDGEVIRQVRSEDHPSA